MKQNRSINKSGARTATSAPKRAVRSSTRARAVESGNERVIPSPKSAIATTDIQYVLPLGNGWVVKASRANTFTAITDSKTEAISIARTLARTKHTKLVVHGKNGAIEIRENYDL